MYKNKPRRNFLNIFLSVKNLIKSIEHVKKKRLYAWGYPQRLRLQRQLYGINTVPFLIFKIPCN